MVREPGKNGGGGRGENAQENPANDSEFPPPPSPNGACGEIEVETS